MRGKLPRKVRSIRRRLDRYDRAATDSSAALTKLQGEMSNLTRMMSNMTTAFQTFHTMNTVPEGTTQPISHNFAAPPPLPNQSLSPILETATPTPTTTLANAPPFSPQLGKFTPDQLPLPPTSQSLPSVRQNTHVTTPTQPIVTTVPSSSTQTNYTQNTNPQNQPHHYTPTNSQPSQNYNHNFSQNTFPFPYNPYMPPQPPYYLPHPTYTTYLPQPAPPNPYQYNPPPANIQQQQTTPPIQDHQNNQNHTYNEPHLRTPHVELPIFQGNGPRA